MVGKSEGVEVTPEIVVHCLHANACSQGELRITLETSLTLRP
jgi:hypothetical protein